MELKYSEDLEKISEDIDYLEQNLMKYDKLLNSNIDDRTIIHNIFRNEHNLKSCLTLLGEVDLSEIVHMMETNYDLIRNGFLEGSKELIDTSLQAVDLIRKNIIKKTETFPQDINIIKNSLEKFSQKKCKEKSKQFIDFKLNSMEKKIYDQAIGNHNNIFLIEKMIGSNISEEDFNSLPIYEDILEFGKVIAISLKYNEIDKSAPHTLLKILIESHLNQEEISQFVFDPFHPVFQQPQKPKILLFNADYMSFEEISKVFKTKYDIEFVRNISFKESGEILIQSLDFDHLTYYLKSKDYLNVKNDFKKLILHTKDIPENQKNDISKIFHQKGIFLEEKPAAILNKGNDFFFIISRESLEAKSV